MLPLVLPVVALTGSTVAPLHGSTGRFGWSRQTAVNVKWWRREESGEAQEDQTRQKRADTQHVEVVTG